MKNWKDASIEELNISSTFGNGNTQGGPDEGGKGNGEKLNQQWTEAQKDGNTTFWGGITGGLS